MSGESRTYLELSEEGGGSHKFYEVVISGTEVRIRYGRIGTDGTSKVHAHASESEAESFATAQIAKKVKKGYAPAVEGQRQKRPVTRRVIDSQPSTEKARGQIVWKFDTGAPAFGIFVDARHCWVGNQQGRIFCLDHSGQVLNQYKLPDGVKCLVSDGEWLYAGCDDGRVYDLSGQAPTVAYEVAEDVDIFWLDIRDGVLGVSDAAGNIVIINHEDESQWTRRSRGAGGWMVRCDEIGVYHGHAAGVTMYDWEDGEVIWERPTEGAVYFGWQEESTVYAATRNYKVHQFTKRGELRHTFACDFSVFSCAALDDGRRVFAGDARSSIYCFDGETGARLWKMDTGCGSPFSMQAFGERLFLVTTDGSLTCLDVSEAGLRAAREGTVRKYAQIAAPAVSAAIPVATSLERTREVGSGIVLACSRLDGKLRVRVVGGRGEFDPTWNVQFPKNLREEGARYVVDELVAARGGFYRTRGEIRRLD